MLIGSMLAEGGLTSFGTVAVEEIQFVNGNGAKINALLYVPKNIAAIAPAPAVVACHGYSASNDAQELHAIELSRRGFVVMAIDAYAHGLTRFPNMEFDRPVNDIGIYSALQYLGRLPFVDKDRLGLTGHSMGGSGIRFAALRAFEEKQRDSSVAVPRAILITSNSFVLVKELDDDPMNAYPVNYGVSFSEYDEFASIMWGVAKGRDYKTTAQFSKGMGFDGAEYGKFYAYGNSTPLSRNEAIAAANRGTLRAGFTIPHAHSSMTFSNKSAAISLRFFDVTLAGGKLEGQIPYTNQIWRWKNVGGGVNLAGFLLLIFSLGLFLLTRPFFKTIVHPEPESLTTISTAKDTVIYAIFYAAALLAPALLYVWAIGVPIYAPFAGMTIPVIFKVNRYFQLPTANGLVFLHLVLTVFYIALFAVIYFGLAKKKGATLASTGLHVTRQEFGKSLLLAALVFLSGYLAVTLCAYFFHVDVGFFKFVFKPLPDFKWSHFLRYLPFFFEYYLVTGVLLNAVTRINKQKEWLNTALIVFANVGGLALHQIYDYVTLGITGLRGVPMVPGTVFPNALSGILMYGLLFILPVIALIARIFYKKTGRVWVGSMLNALVVTFYLACTATVGFVQ
ncbi:MAG: alpha/beta hydrolase [Treponema sp.]|nr:alpha/beta hydrolase [Treponema sp.]